MKNKKGLDDDDNEGELKSSGFSSSNCGFSTGGEGFCLDDDEIELRVRNRIEEEEEDKMK